MITLKTLLYNIFIFILLLFFIESSIYISKKIKGDKSSSWLVLKNDDLIKEMHDPCKRMIQHPLLSRIHDHNGKCVIPDGFVDGDYVFYHPYKKNTPAIVTFGGSTTDGMRIDISNGQTWPKLLNDKLKKFDITVINGGVASHGSSQTNLKLNFLKNSIPNNIKMVISLEGINEIKAHYSEDTPYSGLSLEDNSNVPYMTDTLLSSYLYQTWHIINEAKVVYFPNILEKINKYVKRIKNRKIENYKKNIYSSNKIIFSPAELWEINAYKNYYISKSLNAEFILILQPSMGASQNQIPKKEIEGSNDWNIYHNANPNYFKNLQSFYGKLKIKCSKMTFCYDLSDSVTPITGDLFKDYRHHNENGNQVLTEDIYKILQKKLQLNQ